MSVPPVNSTTIVVQPSTCGQGTPMAWRIAMNTSGPRISVAQPCWMKPNPTMSRSEIADYATGSGSGEIASFLSDADVI